MRLLPNDKVYVISSESLLRDERIHGIYTSYRKAIKGLQSLLIAHRWKEDDRFCVYLQLLNDTDYYKRGSLETAIVEITKYGEKFTGPKYEEMYYHLTKDREDSIIL